jgi:hypothetical protein
MPDNVANSSAFVARFDRSPGFDGWWVISQIATQPAASPATFIGPGNPSCSSVNSTGIRAVCNPLSAALNPIEPIDSAR